MAASGEDKTEAPTGKKRAEARKDGQVARTPDFGSWASLLLIGLVITPLLRHEFEAQHDIAMASLNQISDPSIDMALELLGQGATHAFISVIALAGIVMVVSVAAAIAQGGFFVAPKTLKPKLQQFNPVEGAKRLFGPLALWQGAKMLLKSAVMGVIAWQAVTAMMPLVGGFVPIDAVLEIVKDRSIALLRIIGFLGVLFAAVDYVITKRRHEKQLKMTKSEVKQEHKQAEGDPLVKNAIRSKQFSISRQRMMSDVAEADVLLVNPTHVAVAVRYDPTHGAPTVVARGAGEVAARIRAEAAKHRVPLVHDVPLARALYRSCEVGQEIPAELWAAVAQVLAFVISRRNHGQYGGEHRTPRSDRDRLPEVPRAGAGRKRRPGDESDPPPPVPPAGPTTGPPSTPPSNRDFLS